jgi:hypothetical protein
VEPKEIHYAIRQLMAHPPIVSYLDLSKRAIRFCPSRCDAYDIIQTSNDVVMLSTKRDGLPFAVQLTHWLSETHPNVSAADLLDGCISIFGRVYNKHKEESAELLKAQTVLEEIIKRIK